MILHQQIFHPKNAPLEPWFAIHVESLLLYLCEERGSIIRVTPLPVKKALFTSHTTEHIDQRSVTNLVRKDIESYLPRYSTKAIPPVDDHTASYTFPPYILFNSLDGNTPAILYTQDPVAIYFADLQTSILRPGEHFRSCTDFSVEGWTYWWEDAQRAFHKLSIQFCIDAEMPVPTHIVDAVKHD